MTIYEMQGVCNKILIEANKPLILVKLGRKNARRSRAHARPAGNYITIAPFIFAYPEEVQIAEIVHESCHFLANNYMLPHGVLFRQKEKYWLERYNLKPLKYVGSYNRVLQNAAGEVIPTRGIGNFTKNQVKRFELEMKAKSMSKRTKHERITL